MSRPRQVPTARRRFDLATDLLADYGFQVGAPERLPRGLFAASVWSGQWHLKGVPDIAGRFYLEVGETLDTRLSNPEPWHHYEYLVFLDRGSQPSRIVSFHKDRTKPADLLYHWHDYRDGERRSAPTATQYTPLRWFLDAAWELIVEPDLPVPTLLERVRPRDYSDPT